MAKKTIGHIELQWTCPNCGGVNPGSVQVCNSCGAPQPEDVEFEQPIQQVLITDEKAEVGPDIHCPYCGTRNPGNAKTCNRCGGDLTGGEQRSTGRVLGAFKPGQVVMVSCPNCGTKNPETEGNCSNCGGSLHVVKKEEEGQASPSSVSKAKTRKGLTIAVIAIILLVCGSLSVFAILSMRTQAETGIVQSVSWQLSIPIEALVPVNYQDWKDQIPQNAELGSCDEKIRYVQDQPTTDSVEVCGTPYNVDTGNGYAEVVQDCEYRVYDQYCNYSQDEWRQLDTVVSTGNDFSPIWPEPSLGEGQRIGESGQEIYRVTFDSGDHSYIYQTSDLNLFQKCQIGSKWRLNINTFGAVVSIEP
jgi:ribosomal protein L40E